MTSCKITPCLDAVWQTNTQLIRIQLFLSELRGWTGFWQQEGYFNTVLCFIKPNFSAIEGSFLEQPLFFQLTEKLPDKYAPRWLNETWMYIWNVALDEWCRLFCRITLVLFTTDQKNTVYRGYIDLREVLMFLHFLYSLFSYTNISCVFCRGLHEYQPYLTRVTKLPARQHGPCMGITDSSFPPRIAEIPQPPITPAQVQQIQLWGSFGTSSRTVQTLI